MNSIARPLTAPSRVRSGFRQILVVVAIGTIVALGSLAAAKFVGVSGERAAAAAVNASQVESYTGSILYMPNYGNICRQLQFDNRNGQFTDIGYVDCAVALYHVAVGGQREWSSPRAEVIGAGFRSR
jgi:hypothetical protein